jgi:hypothetical protein
MDKNLDISNCIIQESEESKKPIQLTMNPGVMAEDIKFRMTTETKKELEALAKKYNMSVGEVIRQLVKQGMEILKSGDKK